MDVTLSTATYVRNKNYEYEDYRILRFHRNNLIGIKVTLTKVPLINQITKLQISVCNY